MIQMDSTIRQPSDTLPGEVVYASGIRRGDVILSGGRKEPVVGDPVRTGDVVAVPVTVDGQRRTRRFGPGQPMVVRRADPAAGGADEGDLLELTEAGAQLVDAGEGAQDPEPQRVEAGEVKRGMVLDVFGPHGEPVFREVAHVEPVVDAAEPAVLLVYRGGAADRYDSSHPLRLVPEAEWAERKARIRDGEKRARMRAGLMRLVELLDGGLPLPYQIEIDASLLPTADDVRRAAEMLGAEVNDKTRPDGQPGFDVKAALPDSNTNLRHADVLLRMWHLGAKPPRPADEPAGGGS